MGTIFCFFFKHLWIVENSTFQESETYVYRISRLSLLSMFSQNKGQTKKVKTI